MTYPKSRHCSFYTSTFLAGVLAAPANARLKTAFEKATGAELCISPGSRVIVFGAPSEEAIARVETALQDMEAGLTLPTTRLKSILKKNGF